MISLRYRLNIIILLICFFSFILTGFVTLMNARQSVFEEVSSTLLLAKKLIGHEVTDNQLSILNSVRHLRVSVLADANSVGPIPSETALSESVPLFFVQFVWPTVEPLTMIVNNNFESRVIKLVADPSDEVAEAWHEVLVFIGLLLLLMLFILGSVFIVIGRSLRPVDDIIFALTEIEAGNYQKHSGQFNLPEFAKIAKGVNHLSVRLAESQRDNRLLSKKALNIRENERCYLARELHDEMGQSLSAIKAVSAFSQRSETTDIDSLKKIDAISDHIINVVRNRMRQLTPALLAEFGLSVAIKELVDKWEGLAGVKLSLDASVDTLVGDDGIHLYRIIQESLTNILKYADARQVWIELTTISLMSETLLVLTIRDDGVGFDSKEVEWGGGLSGIKERAESLNGILTLGLNTPRGARLSVEVKLGTINE